MPTIKKDSSITGLTGQIITSPYIGQSIQELDSVLHKQKTDNNLQNLGVFGLTDRSKVSITLSGVDKDTVNVNVVSGSYSYYFNGELVTVTQNKSIQLLGSPTHTNGAHFIYFNDNQGTLAISNMPWDLLNTVSLALVFWYQGNAQGSRALLADEKHTCMIPQIVHKILHYDYGTQLVSGGGITGYTLDTATNAGVTFGISESVINDEDIFITLAALTDGNGTGANYSLIYHTNANTWGFTQGNNVPVLHVQSGRIYYDGLASGLVQITNNNFMNYYLWFTNFEGEARFLLMPSQFEYGTLTAAQSETIDQLNLNGFPASESVCVARFTLESKDSYTNLGKFRIRSVTPLNVSLTNVVSNSGGVPANLVSLEASTFSGTLDTTTVDVQQMAAKVDDLNLRKNNNIVEVIMD